MIRKKLDLVVLALLVIVVAFPLFRLSPWGHLIKPLIVIKPPAPPEEVEKGRGVERHAGANLDLIVNDARKIEDFVLLDVSLVNNTKEKDYFASTFVKLKDKNFMECRRMDNLKTYYSPGAGYKDLPYFTEKEKKGILMQSNLFPGETVRGFLCFQCPD